MYESRKKVMVKVNAQAFRASLKASCRHGRSMSKRLESLGLSSAYFANGLNLYEGKERKFEQIYGYFSAETYEKVCKSFKVDPRTYCDEWDEYVDNYRPISKKTEEVVTDGTTKILDKLTLLDTHIIEQTVALRQIGNLLAQINEKIQYQKPKANAPTNDTMRIMVKK